MITESSKNQIEICLLKMQTAMALPEPLTIPKMVEALDELYIAGIDAGKRQSDGDRILQSLLE